MVSRQGSDLGKVSTVGCGSPTQWLDQYWKFVRDSTDQGYFHLYSEDKKACLIVRNLGSNANVAVLGSCGHYSDQEFFVHYRSDAWIILQRKLDSYCLHAPGIGDWQQINVHACNGELSDNWFQQGPPF